MCETYEKYIKDPHWKAVFAMLDDLVNAAEKAHPTLPDNIKEIVCSGLGRVPGWYEMYYIDMETSSAIYHEHKKRKRSKTIKDILSWGYLLYSPTCSRKAFEKWVEKLEDFETLEEIVEAFSVSETENDL